MSAAPQCAGIEMALSRQLRRAGLSGRWMRAGLAGDRLQLAGERGGKMGVELVLVERMRVGYLETKGAPSHEALLWRAGDAAPLVLAPMRPLRDPSAAPGNAEFREATPGRAGPRAP